MLSAEDSRDDATGHAQKRAIELAHEQPFALGMLSVVPALRQVSWPDAPGQTLEPRVMQVLVALHRADGAIVSRDDLIRSCWRGTIVGDDSINLTIAVLRRLAEGNGHRSFRIETIPRVGYRLLPVEDRENPSNAQMAPRSRKLIFGAAFLVLIVLAGTFAFWRTTTAGPVYSLSVQPFRSTYGAAGFEAALSSALTGHDIPTAGGQVRLALTGSIEQVAGVIHVNVQLASLGDGAQIWNTTAQLPRADPASLSAMVAAIATNAQCILSFANDADRVLAPDLLSRFARGCELMIRGDTEHGLRIARQLTAQAPDFAGGWFLRAGQAIGLYLGKPKEEAALRQEAQAAAEKLVALRPSSQDAVALQALTMAPERAVERERLLRRAVTLVPIFSENAEADLGDFLLQTGRLEEAFHVYRANAQKNPELAVRQAQLFFASAATGRWPIADEALGRIRQINARALPLLLWRNAVWRGDWAQAERYVPLELPAQEQAGIATYRALAAGDAARKTAAARLVLALPNECCVPLRIEMLTLLGHSTEAIALLDRFEAARTPGRRPGNIGLFLWDPALRPLWSDPAMLPFLQRNGWISYWRASKSRPDLCKAAKAPAFCRLLKN